MSLDARRAGRIISICALGIAACAPAAQKRTPTPVASAVLGSSSSPAPSASAKPVEARDEDAEVASAAKEWLDLMIEVSPEDASAIGLHAGDDRLDARTRDAFALGLAREEALLASLRKRFEARPLTSRSAKTDATLLVGSISVDVRKKRDTKPIERRPDFYVAPLDSL